ncbi:hypothetical protein VNI00_003399 [Paramarasmius palmivorus]|uniref:ARM repeat superfamily protein n=1 Tax=Paramarasmius palmivorus TaxID=297713 RepID=A0AAW0DUU1_9AGAR
MPSADLTTAANPPEDLLELQKQLTTTAEQLRGSNSEGGDELWQDVTRISRTLANALRVTDGPVDNHTALGQTSLPQTLSSLYTLALHGSATPDLSHSTPILEILRVSANLCMDHDDNRASLLDAGLPQALVSLLESYADTIPPPPYTKPLSLDAAHLKLIRTAMGVLLNASVGYDPVKDRLNSLEAGKTILKLSTAIYPTGSWLTQPTLDNISAGDELEEAWNLRSSLSNWAWRTILELKDVKDESLQIFTPDVLPYLTSPLVAFSSPYISPSPSEINADLLDTLLQADFENLEESCSLLESLSLDVEDVRLSLARGFQFPAEHGGVPCFSHILDFLERGEIPPFWKDMPSTFDVKRKEKAFDMFKAALIKSVVEVVGEERNEDVLWDDSEEDTPGGQFVSRMVQWLKRCVSDMDKGEGNLARREKNASVLLSPPHSLAPVLTSTHLLSPDSDIKVKHGVLGLLKHLAQSSFQSSSIQSYLTKAETVKRVCECGIWDQRADAMAEVVQVSAIGVVKHLCNANVENTFALVLPSTSAMPPVQTGLSQILALVKRSDSVPVKSEGTRVLVNIVKSLWSSDIIGATPAASQTSPSSDETSDDIERRRQEAKEMVLTLPCASALANLVARSAKYPLLVNEVLLEPPPSAEPPSASSSVATEAQLSDNCNPSTRGRLPVPRTALDMLISVLKNVDNPVNFQPEVRINVCSLLIQLGRNGADEVDYPKVKETVRPVMEELAEGLREATGIESTLAKAVARVLETWA